MRKISALQEVVNNMIIVIAAMTAVFLSPPVYAKNSLDHTKNILRDFKEQLSAIIPIAAAVILLFLAIGYAGRHIEKDTFVRWAIGVVIAGSAVEIANMLFKGGN